MADISWLRGGGLAGQIVSASDWADTALGDPADWSPVLRTSLNIVLHSPMPTLLVWGAARNMLYNDAFAAGIGDLHPAAFGARMADIVFWPALREAHEAAIESAFDGCGQLLEEREQDRDRRGPVTRADT